MTVRHARSPGTAPLLLAGALLTALGTEAAPGAVRNLRPEIPAARPDEQWPIASPGRLLRAAPPGHDVPERLLQRFLDLHTAMRYDDAHRAALDLVAAAEDRSLPRYNLACVLTRLHQRDAALEALEGAVARGWRNRLHAEIDLDLEPLRDDPRFALVLDRMQSLAESERIRGGPLRDEPWERVATDLVAAVPDLLGRYHVPGAAVALVRDGRCVWSGAFGSSDPATGAPIVVETVFRVGSPADLLALTAAARLDVEDRLELADVLLQGEIRAERASGMRTARRALAGTAFGSVEQRRGAPPPDGPGGAADVSRWPAAASIPESLDLLRLAVELAARRDFDRYCHEAILLPLGMSRTSSAAPAAPACVGHSPLGTPLGAGASEGRAVVHTTARDLARLVELMLAGPGEDAALDGRTAAAVGDAGRFQLGRLGIRVHADPTPGGWRFQVADVTDGVGCLMRWYPDSRCGVVVLFNSETGTDAALRIAHLALGGR